MNEQHLIRCASADWAETVERTILPWAVGDRPLGGDVLEVGPGPGRTTDALRRRVARLTAVEPDPELAARLAARLGGGGVVVVRADATALPFRSGRFTAATSFTMLHHVPSPAMQDRLLAEVCRVLRPGGLLVGVDSLDRPSWRALHEGDVCVPVDPAGLAARLAASGFTGIEVEAGDVRFRFAAVAPDGA